MGVDPSGELLFEDPACGALLSGRSSGVSAARRPGEKVNLRMVATERGRALRGHTVVPAWGARGYHPRAPSPDHPRAPATLTSAGGSARGKKTARGQDIQLYTTSWDPLCPIFITD